MHGGNNKTRSISSVTNGRNLIQRIGIITNVSKRISNARSKPGPKLAVGRLLSCGVGVAASKEYTQNTSDSGSICC